MDNERGPFLSNPFVARAARWGLLAWSVIGLVILIGLAYRFVLFPIRVIFPPLVVALVVIYLLNPIITEIQKRGVRRIWATLLIYVAFLAVAVAVLSWAIPAVAHQVTEFVALVPRLLRRAGNGLADLGARLGVTLNTKDLLRPFQPNGGSAFSFFGRLTSFTAGVVRVAFVLVLGPLLAFYLLVDLPKIQRGAEALVPATRRREATELVTRINATLGGFFRGQLLVAVLVGLVSTLGFWVTGLPFFALLGALTGLFALVPLIGTVIAAVPALFVAFTTTGRTGGVLHLRGGWWLALASVLVLVLAQELNSRVLGPRLLSPAIRLHPVTVLLSLLVGGTLLGLWGMLLAVPVVAALKVSVLYLWDTRSKWPPDVAGVVPGGPGKPPRLAPVRPEQEASERKDVGEPEKEAL